MNHLDAAIKNLQGSLRDIESQQRVLEREHGRLAKALALLTGTAGTPRPVAAITGVKVIDSISREEAARRREMVDIYLASVDRPFSWKDFMRESGEPSKLGVNYRTLFVKLAKEGTVHIFAKGSGRRPTLYFVDYPQEGT